MFNIFLNDQFLCLTDSDLHNFAEANAIPVKNLNDLLQTLEEKINKKIDWLNNNHMMVNRDKFQAIVLSKIPSSASFKLNTYVNHRETAKVVIK